MPYLFPINQNLVTYITDIDTEGTRQVMKNLDPFKANGPDKAQSQFLKLMPVELSVVKTLLVKASFNQAKIPNARCDALVLPLYKSGKTDRRNPEKYRPITSVSCKLLEHIILTYNTVILTTT